jgi:hypothetical protein
MQLVGNANLRLALDPMLLGKEDEQAAPVLTRGTSINGNESLRLLSPQYYRYPYSL